VATGYELLAYNDRAASFYIEGDTIYGRFQGNFVAHPDALSDTNYPRVQPPVTGCGVRQYNFRSAGCVDTGNASMIIERTTPLGANVDVAGLDIVAMSFRTPGPITFPAPGGTEEFVQARILKFQNEFGNDIGQVFGGTLNPNDQFLQIFENSDRAEWALRYTVTLLGEKSGNTLRLAWPANVPGVAGQAGFEWGRTAPDGALKFDGINYLLNGVDESRDFWRLFPTDAAGRQIVPDGQFYNAGAAIAPIPLPPGIILLASAMGGLFLRRGRRAV
jgi:hypothetical protein